MLDINSIVISIVNEFRAFPTFRISKTVISLSTYLHLIMHRVNQSFCALKIKFSVPHKCFSILIKSQANVRNWYCISIIHECENGNSLLILIQTFHIAAWYYIRPYITFNNSNSCGYIRGCVISRGCSWWSICS